MDKTLIVRVNLVAPEAEPDLGFTLIGNGDGLYARATSPTPTRKDWDALRVANAAPDLLKALIALSGIGNPPGGDLGHINYREALELTRAALKKAQED